MALETVVRETGAEPVGTIIWLHGLGADGHDFEPIVPELGLPVPLRFVFPHAPVRPVTINGGMAMRAWFDIVSLDRNGDVDEQGIDESCAALDALVAAEIERGMTPDRIVLAGFSQGGVIAMHTALRAADDYAGLMVLSSYLPLVARLQGYPDKSGLPVFLAHGDFDPMLPLPLGEAIRETLTASGLSPQWHRYPMAHAVCPQEITDISQWLRGIYT